MKTKRIFIVAPQNYDGDTLWKVCSTTSKDSFSDIYWKDNYEEMADFDNKTDAINYAKSKGHRITKRNIT